MEANGYQAFKFRLGELKPHGDPKPTQDEVESTIKIAADSMSDVTYVVLPVYTNKLPIPKDGSK